jgi:hypothetical protein
MYIKRQNNVFTAIHTTGRQHVYMAEIFEDIYYNPANPASFSGPEKLFHFVQKDGK